MADNSQSENLAEDNIVLIDQTKKRKANDDSVHQPALKKPFIHYIPFEYLTREVMEKCVSFGTPFEPSGKAATIGIRFNYNLFNQLNTGCPIVKPKSSKALYTNHPFLESPFGYGAHADKEGKVGNNLRFKADDPINEEARKYFEEVIPEWDKFWLAKAIENKKTWPLKVTKKGEKPEDVPDEKIADKQKPFIRSSDADFPDYIQFQCQTVKADERREVKEDPYTVELKVWNNDGKLLKNTLYEKNGNEYEGDDKEHIFLPGMYAKGIFHMKHLALQAAGFGLTCVIREIRIAKKEDLKKDDENDEEVCNL